jgi:hypothetical protein
MEVFLGLQQHLQMLLLSASLIRYSIGGLFFKALDHTLSSNFILIVFIHWLGIPVNMIAT